MTSFRGQRSLRHLMTKFALTVGLPNQVYITELFYLFSTISTRLISIMKHKQSLFTLLSCSAAVLTGTLSAQAASFEILANGLNNPRGLSFGTDGSIFVGETGTGGSGNCQPSPSTMFADICAGNTGSVTQITPDGTQSRIITGVESLALQPTQEQGAGPQQLKFDSNGDAYLLVGYAGFPGNRDLETNLLAEEVELQLPPDQALIAPPAPPEGVLGTEDLAKLFQVDLETQEFTEVFDFAEYEILNNVDGGDYITNPYDLEISDGSAYVVDAGANVIYELGLEDGTVDNAFAAPTQFVTGLEFPPTTVIPPTEEGGIGADPDQLPGVGEDPSPDARDSSGATDGAPMLPDALDLQSVPTGATIGPDGAYYFAELTGFPYPEGEARVFRVGENGTPEVYADGFTQIADIVFDEEGNLLVLQFADLAQWKESVEGSLAGLPGSIQQVASDGSVSTLLDEGIFSATGIEVDNNGDIIVVNNGVGTGGQVVRIDSDSLGQASPGSPGGGSQAVPEPASIFGLIAFGFGSGVLLKNKRKKSAFEE